MDLEDVEADGLGQGTAFTDSDNITGLDTNEGGRAVRSEVLVSLLVTVVLLDVVQVFTTDDDGAFHLGGNDLTSKNTTTDGNVSSEGTLLINVSTSDGFLRGLESQTDILVPARTFTLWDNTLVVHEDGVLLLEGLVMSLYVSKGAKTGIGEKLKKSFKTKRTKQSNNQENNSKIKINIMNPFHFTLSLTWTSAILENFFVTPVLAQTLEF